MESLFCEDVDNGSWWQGDAFVGMPIPKMPSRKRKDEVPSTLMVAKYIQNVESRRLLHVLLDSGGSHTLVHERILPRGANPIVDPMGTRTLQTIAGSFSSKRMVHMKGLSLPEFDKQKEIDGVDAFVFGSECNYDVILGRDFLQAAGIKMDFQNGTIHWLEKMIRMKTPGYWSSSAHVQMALMDEVFEEDEDLDESERAMESLSAEIQEAKYEKVTAKQVADAQNHLTVEQRLRLERVLEKYPVLFNGELGHFTGRKIRLEVVPGAVPFHSKAYSVPKSHELVFLKELKHL
ncbi:MAG: retropepsin-like aspartic protease, partial [Marinobacter sp.]